MNVSSQFLDRLRQKNKFTRWSNGEPFCHLKREVNLTSPLLKLLDLNPALKPFFSSVWLVNGPYNCYYNPSFSFIAFCYLVANFIFGIRAPAQLIFIEAIALRALQHKSGCVKS
jgi:hypothetical protein